MVSGRAAILLSSAWAFGCSSTDPLNPTDSGVITDAPSDLNAPDRRDAAPANRSGIEVTGPARLSETGLYSDFGARTIAPGIIEYAPRWPFWNDGASQRRWIQLPQGKAIDTSDMNQWVFPEGTKLWMELSVGGKPLEVRFLWKRGTGWFNWWMGAYVWRADGSEADYFENGQTSVLGTTHDAPTQTQCVQCHDGIIDVGVGFSALQLSAPQNSQLARFAGMGMFTKPPNKEFDAPGSGTVKLALSLMHANCGNCHVETSRLFAQQSQVSLHLKVTDMVPEDTGAYAAINFPIRHIDDVYGLYFFVPGKPNQSQAWLRMNVRNPEWAMPPFDTKQTDVDISTAVGWWIAALPPGPDQ